MATDIDNTAEFSFNNMKPAADEEITALWGKNIADNTGFLRNLPTLVSSFSNTITHENHDYATYVGTTHFKKLANFNTLHGTFYAETGTLLFHKGSMYLYVNGVEVGSAYFPGDNTRQYGHDTIDVDVSSFTDNADYPITWKYKAVEYAFGGSWDINVNLGVSIYGTQT